MLENFIKVAAVPDMRSPHPHAHGFTNLSTALLIVNWARPISLAYWKLELAIGKKLEGPTDVISTHSFVMD